MSPLDVRQYREQQVRLAALEAEVERLEGALKEIGQHDWERGDGWAQAVVEEALPEWNPDLGAARAAVREQRKAQ